LSEGLIPVISCEHGGNRIPEKYRRFFSGHETLLASHRGWDPGALPLAREIAQLLGVPLHASTVSRLMVELNRSPHHRSLFSSLAREIPPEVRETILQEYYWPYRKAVWARIAEETGKGRCVLHLAIHTFTPVLDGRVREMEMGILYDPARQGERAFSQAWRTALRARVPEKSSGIRIRFNQPYRGRSDGLPTWLRKGFPDQSYLGIEVEVNQGLIQVGRAPWGALKRAILTSLEEILAG
jgi:predicted N-formylglutamate amidohydrolase